MGDIGTFGTFTTARLGIYAAQKGLSVTGNNIANINTLGYTRQALDQVSLNAGSGDRYQSRVNVGSGVRCIGVSQLRDPYLDIRYRTEMATVGAMDSKLSGLDRLSAILDEVAKNDGDGVLEKMLTDLTSALDDLSLSAGQAANDSAVRSAATALVKQLNAYAKSLNEVHENTVDILRQDITTVNGILTNIRDLNASIRKSEIHGDNALELRDQRNNLIDQLSQYMKIDVKTVAEDIGAGKIVDKLVITLGNANPERIPATGDESDCSVLVDGMFATQLLTPKANPDYPAAPGSLPYLDIHGQGTADPSKADVAFDDNYSIMLGALTDSNGRVQSGSSIELDPIGQDAFDSNTHITTQDQYGNITKLVEHIKKTVKVSAEVSGTGVTGPDFDASGLNLAAIARAGKGLPNDGPVNIFYNSETSKLELQIGGETVGASGELTFPLAAGTQISFLRDTGASLGSIKVSAETQSTAFDQAQSTGLTFTAAHTKDEHYEKTTTYTYSYPVSLHDNDLYGSLQSTREMLTEKGEFATADDVLLDPDATIKRGIPYYQKTLDTLAKKLADTFNEANTSWQVDKAGNYLDTAGNIMQVAGENLTKDGLTDGQRTALLTAGYGVTDSESQPVLDDDGKQVIDLNKYLKDNGGKQLGGALFSNHGSKDDADGITAANISISFSWSKGDVGILCSTLPDPGSQANDNVLHMISLMGTKLEYTTPDGQEFFTGTFQEMLANITGTLADEVSITSISLDNAYASAVDLDTSRDSVSGVDLNDEAMSMMQYQKSYAAACRLMTTLDEILDKLINGTGIAGR